MGGLGEEWIRCRNPKKCSVSKCTIVFRVACADGRIQKPKQHCACGSVQGTLHLHQAWMSPARGFHPAHILFTSNAKSDGQSSTEPKYVACMQYGVTIL